MFWSLLDLILVCSRILLPSLSEWWDLPLGKQESLIATGIVALWKQNKKPELALSVLKAWSFRSIGHKCEQE